MSTTNTSRFWLMQRVRDDLRLYGVLGTYYLLREEFSLPTTIYAMCVAHSINKHNAEPIGVRITPNL